MTNQEIFDTAVLGLRRQGVPALDGGKCRYRTADGLRKCAIGMCIPDDAYRPAWECNSIAAVLLGAAALRSSLSIGEDQTEFVEELQCAHDQPALDDVDTAVRPWLGRFLVLAEKLAEAYRLDPSALTAPL